MKLYYCQICGKFEIVTDGKLPECCGTPMIELIPNNTEASVEKHLPVINIDKKAVNINVGSVLHPMTEDHYIRNIVIVTNKGFYNVELNHLDKPMTTYELKRCEKLVKVYAYCNLHGLWVTAV